MADTRQSGPAWLLPTVVVGVLAVLAIAWVLLRGGQDVEQATTPQPSPAVSETGAEPAPRPEPASASEEPPAQVEDVTTPDLTQYEARDPDDVLAAGAVDAPVALVVFSDYQCQFCAKWSNETLPVMWEYVEAGDLRIEWRDVNIFGDASERGALAAYAAARQDRFLDYHAELFPDGQVRSERALSYEELVAIATDIGLDVAQFEADYASDAAQQAVGANEDLGAELGAFSTPSFILGGTPIVGAQPTEVFIQTFQDALASSEG